VLPEEVRYPVRIPARAKRLHALPRVGQDRQRQIDLACRKLTPPLSVASEQLIVWARQRRPGRCRSGEQVGGVSRIPASFGQDRAAGR
jgi:hypothetical protein